MEDSPGPQGGLMGGALFAADAGWTDDQTLGAYWLLAASACHAGDFAPVLVAIVGSRFAVDRDRFRARHERRAAGSAKPGDTCSLSSTSITSCNDPLIIRKQVRS